MTFTPIIVGIAGYELTESERALFARLRPAGYVLFTRNIECPGQVRALTDSLRSFSTLPPLIGIDQEGGRVVRTKQIGVELPSAQSLARANNSQCIVDQAKLTARLLLQLGINTNFAPVLDIGRKRELANALNGGRCWGTSAQEVTSHGYTYLDTLRRAGIIPCGKHFPGLGRAEVDAHFELPTVEATEDEMFARDLLPFTAFSPKELPTMMVGHVFYPTWDKVYPSSLSKAILTDLLRLRLGYSGVVMTDDLDMHAITRHFSLPQAARLTLEAGADLAMICHSLDALDEVAHGLSSLASPLLYDIETRLERLFRTFPTTKAHRFEESIVERVIEDTATFAEKFYGRYPECAPVVPMASVAPDDEGSGDISPVQTY